VLGVNRKERERDRRVEGRKEERVRGNTKKQSVIYRKLPKMSTYGSSESMNLLCYTAVWN
jgi:hypothetical protein